jgi:hypothetical protein
MFKVRNAELGASVILATQEAEIRRIAVQSQLREPILKKAYHEKRLVEWLKVEVLSSSPSIAKINKLK